MMEAEQGSLFETLSDQDVLFLTPEQLSEGAHAASGASIPLNSQVLIQGLKTMHHLNDTTGHVKGFEASKKRYLIVCAKDGETRSIKGENLQIVADA